MNRHLCTSTKVDDNGKPLHVPPHEVNFRAMVWALCVECGCQGIVALGSAGSLHPDAIPVGSVVMPDDYFMVRPEPMTFWGRAEIGVFTTPEGGLGHVHYAPADPGSPATARLRVRVQELLSPVLLGAGKGKVKLASHQTQASWPLSSEADGAKRPRLELPPGVVYVNTVGPRFETRAEIRAYRQQGHVVGMTCANEWALCEELRRPYCLVCLCDNACNGLSLHPGGAVEEYMEHKATIGEVTKAIIQALREGLLAK